MNGFEYSMGMEIYTVFQPVKYCLLHCLLDNTYCYVAIMAIFGSYTMSVQGGSELRNNRNSQEAFLRYGLSSSLMAELTGSITQHIIMANKHRLLYARPTEPILRMESAAS